jgi:hypothetical protein
MLVIVVHEPLLLNVITVTALIVSLRRSVISSGIRVGRRALMTFMKFLENRRAFHSRAQPVLQSIQLAGNRRTLHILDYLCSLGT